jgi:preprotein translocase subunit YajC
MSFTDMILMGAPAGGEANPLAMFLPLVLIFIVFYFFIIRPQKKKEDQRKKMIEAVQKGNRVITIGGVHGTVTQVDETSVLVQVDNNTKLRIEKSALSSVVGKDA